MSESKLSPRGAMLFGSLAIVSGLFPILMGLGVLTPPEGGAQAPPWVPVSAGLAFVLAGVLIVMDHGFAQVGPDDQLVPETPLAIQTASFFLGLAIVGLMTAIIGWVAFGPDPRQFSTTFSLPFGISRSQHSGDLPGRIAFGFGTALLVFIFVACGSVGARRLWRAFRRSPR